MFPCCGYDPGLAAYLASSDDIERDAATDDLPLFRALLAVSVISMGLCYGLLFMVT